jgi:hypothetical protein
MSSGCAPFETFDLPRTPAHNRPSCQAQRGLWVAAELIASPQSIEHHFGPDLRHTEILPALVYLENRGETAFEIHRKDFHLVLERGERFETASPAQVQMEVHRSSYPALVFAPLILPAIYFYRSIEAHNFRVARTLHEKGLDASLRLEPGDPPMVRAVFFRDPSRKLRPERSLASSVLQFSAVAEGTRIDRPPAARGAEVAGTAAAPETSQAAPTQGVGETLSFTVSLSTEEP